MSRVRIGFVSSLSTKGAHALHKAAMIFTREDDPPVKWGRALIKGLEGADAFRFLGTGVAVVYGNDEAAMAKLVLGLPDKVVVTVTKTTPKKDGSLVKAAERLGRNRRKVEHVVIKAKGDVLAANLTPGATFELVEIGAPLHPHSAPSTPRATVAAEKTIAPSVPRAPVAPVIRSAPSTRSAKASAASENRSQAAPAPDTATDAPEKPAASQPPSAPKAEPAPKAKPAEPDEGASER